MTSAVVIRGNWMQLDEESGLDRIDTDAQLMLRFKDGDRQAFEQLFTRYTRAIIGFAYRFVRERQIAEELAQEVFLRVYESAERYCPTARFTTWLYRIATNVCLNEIRKRRFRVVHQPMSSVDFIDDVDRALPQSRKDDPEKILERQAVARAIREALDQLPEKQRLAFILNKYQDLSYLETAEVMKISEKAVKSLIHRAKEALAEKLQPLLPEVSNR